MYLELYGLKNSPFNLTSDPQFFFESASHKEALALLLYGIHEKKGIILITGEVGTGKTTLCKALLNKLPKTIKTSFLLNPYFSDVQLMQAIIEDFGLAVAKRGRLEIMKKLNSFLVETSSSGGGAVLIIDEAQNLTYRQLEQVRLLSNLETAQEKLLQIVLMGQPELFTKLKSESLRQLYQRIAVKYTLLSFKEEELKNYIEFRLKQAGAEDVRILPESYGLIYEFSKGIPRLINMLCDRALLFGFVKEEKMFTPEAFLACIEELK